MRAATQTPSPFATPNTKVNGLPGAAPDDSSDLLHATPPPPTATPQPPTAMPSPPTAMPSPPPRTAMPSPTPPTATPSPLAQPASGPRPELFEIPLTFDLPVSTSAAPVAAPPSAPPSAEAPVVAAPAGFTRLPTAIPATPGAHFVVTSKWVKVVGPHIHVLLVGRTSSPVFLRLGTDITAYVPLLESGLRGKSSNFAIVASRRQPLCDRRDGYLIRYVDRSADPLTATVVFVIAGDTAWTAIYEHDLGSSDLPAGVASMDSLCPPLAARGR